MSRVRDLQPGDVVVHAAESATFVAQAEHPIWPSLRLVIWRMRDGSWSHDALSPGQEVGEVLPATATERQTSLRAALLGESPSAMTGLPDPTPPTVPNPGVAENGRHAASISVQPDWCRALSLQQQSVLLLAARGPDGIPKSHPCKDVQRAYRGTVLVAARYGRLLAWGEPADSFMSLDVFADDGAWSRAEGDFYRDVDQLPHHYLLHLLHGAEILGYKHPDDRFRQRWLGFYRRGCDDMHLTPETEQQMDARLSDWDRADWPVWWQRWRNRRRP